MASVTLLNYLLRVLAPKIVTLRSGFQRVNLWGHNSIHSTPSIQGPAPAMFPTPTSPQVLARLGLSAPAKQTLFFLSVCPCCQPGARFVTLCFLEGVLTLNVYPVESCQGGKWSLAWSRPGGRKTSQEEGPERENEEGERRKNITHLFIRSVTEYALSTQVSSAELGTPRVGQVVGGGLHVPQERCYLLHSIQTGHPTNTEMGHVLSLVHPTPT